MRRIPREIRICVKCSKEFQVLPSRKDKYCSQYCAKKAQRGRGNGRYNYGLSTFGGRAIVMCRDGSWMLWYRVLMWNQLGRELGSDEVIHHINGDHSDDRLENLQVCSQREHIALHRAEMVAARKQKAAA